MIILKSVTFTMTTDSPPRAPPRLASRETHAPHGAAGVGSRSRYTERRRPTRLATSPRPDTHTAHAGVTPHGRRARRGADRAAASHVRRAHTHTRGYPYRTCGRSRRAAPPKTQEQYALRPPLRCPRLRRPRDRAVLTRCLGSRRVSVSRRESGPRVDTVRHTGTRRCVELGSHGARQTARQPRRATRAETALGGLGGRRPRSTPIAVSATSPRSTRGPCRSHAADSEGDPERSDRDRQDGTGHMAPRHRHGPPQTPECRQTRDARRPSTHISAEGVLCVPLQPCATPSMAT